MRGTPSAIFPGMKVHAHGTLPSGDKAAMRNTSAALRAAELLASDDMLRRLSIGLRRLERELAKSLEEQRQLTNATFADALVDDSVAGPQESRYNPWLTDAPREPRRVAADALEPLTAR